MLFGCMVGKGERAGVLPLPDRLKGQASNRERNSRNTEHVRKLRKGRGNHEMCWLQCESD